MRFEVRQCEFIEVEISRSYCVRVQQPRSDNSCAKKWVQLNENLYEIRVQKVGIVKKNNSLHKYMNEKRYTNRAHTGFFMKLPVYATSNSLHVEKFCSFCYSGANCCAQDTSRRPHKQYIGYLLSVRINIMHI